MKVFLRLTAMILMLVLFFSSADASNCSWFCYTCRTYRTTNFCPDCGAQSPYYAPAGETTCPDWYNEPYDMGVPDLHGQVITKDQMNLAVFWVQTQLKATGIYYQGEIWDVTGNLGDHTMQEVASFMQGRGYRGHSGQIDQTVINELSRYMGRRIVPVYVGGFYSYMDTIMNGGHTGYMQSIVSNLRDMIPHVTVGARWIQCCLKKTGYYSGLIDGKYGEETEKAVKAFQKANGFEERDYVSLGVARAMLEQCYYSGCSLYDLP